MANPRKVIRRHKTWLPEIYTINGFLLFWCWNQGIIVPRDGYLDGPVLTLVGLAAIGIGLVLEYPSEVDDAD